MRLKELITCSGGVITAITLLGAMMTMAGATGPAPDLWGTCYLCGESFGLYSITSTTITYQQKYGVANIEGLESGDFAYGSQNPQLLLVDYEDGENEDVSHSICQSCLEEKIAEYKAANSGTISTPGTGSTPVTLTAAASTFNVTVPTSIPLVVGADSKVTSPSDVKIINNSAGPVKVTAIAMNDGTWTMTDYNGGDRSKLAAEKVGSNKLGLSLTAGGNTAASNKDGSQSPVIDSTKWRITGKNTGNNELQITVGAIASAVSTKIENAVTAANVVFTVAWDK